ncbi:MAG TPA: SprT-like domain-containing protein [Pyrinomonadaceae bacterium]|nr:SprT-like domain-containing protein [Pyrinomonadaceae bacterium]
MISKLKFLMIAAVILLGILALYWIIKPSDQPPGESVLPTPVPTAAVKAETKENFEYSAKLQTETNALLPLFGKMPPVPVFLKDEIINKQGSNTERGVAYAACENKNQPTIFVKKVFFEKANRKQLVNILKHELTHAYFCRQGIQEGHDANFRKKFTEVGGFGN